MSEINLPEHHICYIEHNPHKGSYMTVKEYIETHNLTHDIEEDVKEKCMQKDEFWSIQLYPISPISFFSGFGLTFEEALKDLWKNLENYYLYQ